MQLTELHDHLSVIHGDIVFAQLCLVSHSGQERLLLLGIMGVVRLGGSDLRLDFLDCEEKLALNIGHDNLEAKVDDLGGYGEIYDLLGETVRVDLEALRRERLSVRGEFLSGNLEQVQVGN